MGKCLRFEREVLRFALIDFDRRIRFDVFLAIAAEVGHGARKKIHVIANNPCTPTGFEKFWESAFSGLIGSQGCNQGIPVEYWYVHSTRYQRRTLHHDRALIGEEQALARRQRPEIAGDSGPSQALGQIGESSHLRADSGRSLHRLH